MKYCRRILLSWLLALLVIMCYGTVVLAINSIVSMVGVPTSTSILLSWEKYATSDNTVIQYKLTGFPSSHTDGTTAYDGTDYECTLSSLMAGQVYYFAAYEYSGASYSSPYYYVMSTLAVTLPSGAAPTSTNSIPVPTLPANATQTPTTTGFNLEPFTSIIHYFVTDTNGLGMPESNAWETLATFGLVIAGIGTYSKVKNFFVAWFVVLVLSVIAVLLHLMQGLLVPIEFLVGVGVWAVDRYFQ